jgi:hypothetical protein
VSSPSARFGGGFTRSVLNQRIQFGIVLWKNGFHFDCEVVADGGS